MSTGYFHLEPSLPLIWEDFETLRVGFERPEARVLHPTAGMQRAIAAFRRGCSVTQLSDTLRRYGVTAHEWNTLLGLLAPVLTRSETTAEGAVRLAALPVDSLAHPHDASARSKATGQHETTVKRETHDEPLRVCVIGEGRIAEAIRNLVTLSTCQLIALPDLPPIAQMYETAPLPGAPAESHPQASTICVAIEHFLPAFDYSKSLLMEQFPVLLVQATDRSVTVGPLQEPGASPCIHCAGLHLVDSDPALPVLAAQLLGTVAASDTPAAGEAVAALVLSELRRWAAGQGALISRQARLTVQHGLPGLTPTVTALEPHPDCACRRPASARNLDGRRDRDPAPALPETRSRSRARVTAT